MIQSMTIQNIALIETLRIDFHPGFQVLAGETGAGKSIVVDAMNLILGGRADRGLIRSGCEKASVEAIFDVPDHQAVADLLAREGLEYDGRTVTIQREITTEGKNLCRVCGVILSLGFLRELSTHLMDIHGQHEHQFLMDPARHLSFLDRMGNGEHSALLAQTAEACTTFLSAHRRYARLRRENEQKQYRVSELEKLLKELHEAKLKEGEEEALTQECLRLRNSEKIASTLRQARDALSRGETDSSCVERVKEASTALSTIQSFGDNIRALGERCESLYYELQEISYDLSGLTEDSENDPDRLEKAEARLDLIRRLERKHGATLIGEVLATQGRLEEEYARLCGLDDEVGEAAKAHKRTLAAYRLLARELTESRKRIAEAFEQAMMRELADLGMEKAIFSVSFLPHDGEKPMMPRLTGDDDVEFMIAPNPGEPLKPLAKIASGGELSRIMLAIKSMETDNSGVDSMVFDEIDTGISGKMAQAVAEKMAGIAAHRQVICVTHLPQIAAVADWQYLVFKSVQEERTYTTVLELDDEGRVAEIARMIGGGEGSAENAAEYARTLLDAGRKKHGPENRSKI